jgi:hypothetical protein
MQGFVFAKIRMDRQKPQGSKPNHVSVYFCTKPLTLRITTIEPRIYMPRMKVWSLANRMCHETLPKAESQAYQYLHLGYAIGLISHVN